MDLSISEMMEMQKALFDRNKDSWPPMEHSYGKDYVLFMVEEVGEVIAILKKKGSHSIMSDPDVRRDFLEEMSDVLMYYHDILLRFHVTPEEISTAYIQKHNIDIKRDYTKEYEEKDHG